MLRGDGLAGEDVIHRMLHRPVQGDDFGQILALPARAVDQLPQGAFFKKPEFGKLARAHVLLGGVL